MRNHSDWSAKPKDCVSEDTQSEPIELAMPVRAVSRENLLDSAVNQDIYLRALVETGRFTAAAAAVGVTRAVAVNYRANHPDFEELCQEARARHWSYVEGEAERRAIEGVEEPIIWQGEVVATVRKRSDSLLKLLLQTHVEEYRPAQGRLTVNVSATASVTAGAAPAPAGLSLANLDPALMTREQRDLFERLLHTLEPAPMLDVASDDQDGAGCLPHEDYAEPAVTPRPALPTRGESASDD